jgi:heme exporter protein A
MIAVHSLIKRFGVKTVLRKLEFSAQPGEFVALLGPNGAGKTTFLRILSSLSRPNQGNVSIAGFSLPSQASAIRSRLGVVSHQPLVYGDLSAEENLRFYGKLYNLNADDLTNRINSALILAGLEKRRRDLVRTFSRGMQQRLSIGRALLHDPDVLLLDEPHTGLDQDACDRLDETLRLAASHHRTIIITSHDLARVEELASRFDVLSRGVIQASISKKDLPGEGLLEYYKRVINEN